jgi:transposase InsO family protein
MSGYSQQRAARREQRTERKRTAEPVEQAQLRIEVEALRNQRRQQRLARGQADAAWRSYRQQRQNYLRHWRQLSRSEKQRQRADYEAAQADWSARQAARQAVHQARQAEDEAWRQARQELATRRQQLNLPGQPPKQVWLAILVIVDNCTRRCLGLPLFTAGAHVTSEMVIAALRLLLPAELQFLISDNGPQFKADAFAELARTANFIHVRIAPRRACTNGIAERFVQTLKEWLAQHTWTTPEEMERLLTEFLVFYNDRPHQGAELNGLSPNEYARRLAICSTC